MNIGHEVASERAITAARDHETIERMEAWLSDMADRKRIEHRAETSITERAFMQGEELAYRNALAILRTWMAGGGE